MGAMRKSRLSKHKQDRLVEHFVAGTTARCTGFLVGVNFKTSAYYFHRLREIIAYQLEQEDDAVFSGEIEIDESYRAMTRDCRSCPLKQRCCPKMPQRRVPRDINEDARDYVRALAKTKAFKISRDERKKVEMAFAHMKRIFKLDRFRLRGLWWAYPARTR